MLIYNNTISASAIKTYLHCPFKFFLEYILGHKKGPTFPTENGKLIHSSLEGISIGHKKNWKKELFFRYKKFKPWELLADFKNHKSNCPGCQFLSNIEHYHGDFFSNTEGAERNISLFVSKACPINYLFEARDIIQNVIDREDNPFNKKIIDAEKKFSLPLEYGINIGGIIDLISEIDSDTIEIRDWKTGNWLPTYEEALQDPQLRLYDLAVSILYPDYKNRILTFDYIKKKSYTFTVSEEERDFNKRWIISIALQIQRDFNPKRNLTYKCKSFCQPDICDKEWPQKLITIKKLKKEGKI